MRYRLAAPIHVAFFDTRAVILDVRTDRYRLLDKQATALLSHLEVPVEGQDEALARALMAAGILEEGEQSPRIEGPGPSTPALSSIYDREVSHGACVSYLTAAAALVGAASRLRVLGFENTLAHIASRVSRVNLVEPDFRMLDLARSYLEVRTGIPLKRVCLRDSLALHTILTAAGCAPRFLIGVQLDPFRAHCWLEADTVVLNDRLDLTSSFTPILTI
jgi:hypothetical protein